MNNTYIKLINKHKDQNCFVLGAGLSLFDIYTNPLWDQINNNVVISVNSSILSLEWENENKNDNRYWISNDALCRKWSWFNDFVKKNNCIKIVRNSWEKYKDELEGFLFFEPRNTSEGEIDTKEKHLCYCSSVPTAIDLAIQMGCKNIFLLGVDQYEEKGKRYFWELFPRDKQPQQLRPAIPNFKEQSKVFKYNDLAYNALKGFAELKDCNIYNCNEKSKVNNFEKISVIDILRKI